MLWLQRAARAAVTLSSALRNNRSRHRITFVGQPPGHQFQDDPSSLSQRQFQSTNCVPELSYDLGEQGVLTVTMTGRACGTMLEHCANSQAHGCEVGGLLVGHCEESRVSIKARGGRQYHLVVTNALPISSPDSSRASWRVSEEEWLRAEKKMRQFYAPAGKVRLGWYHTHPDQGIFFSAKDRIAHEVFCNAYEFALVIDARDMQAGLFRWAWRPERSIAGPVLFSLLNRRE